MLAASFAGHELGYRIAVPDAHAREHALASSGHGYLAYAPLAAGAAGALVLVALFLVVRRAARGAHASVPPGLFAVLPPLAFTLQEHLERYLHHQGAIPWTAALEPAFVTGLCLQLPFALLALGLARFLTRAAVCLGRALRPGSHQRRLLSESSFRVSERVSLLPLAPLARGASERGPPFST